MFYFIIYQGRYSAIKKYTTPCFVKFLIGFVSPRYPVTRIFIMDNVEQQFAKCFFFDKMIKNFLQRGKYHVEKNNHTY